MPADFARTIADFVAMGGHGLYVWLSYAAALGVVLYNVLSVRLRERRYLREHLDRERRHAGAGVRDAVHPARGVPEP